MSYKKESKLTSLENPINCTKEKESALEQDRTEISNLNSSSKETNLLTKLLKDKSSISFDMYDMFNDETTCREKIDVNLESTFTSNLTNLDNI